MNQKLSTRPGQQISRWGSGWLLVERTAWAIGLVCVAVWAAFSIAGRVGERRELERFAAVKAETAPQTLPEQTESPNLTLWGSGRITAWRDALKQPAPPPLAILHIPKIQLVVPVLPGTDDFALNRGVGHIEDTSLPGADGNSGIAGHRDGFFRGLQNIAPGDTIEIETLRTTDVYRVERTWIVEPEDVSVLDPTATRSITLVTCYPFYYVGSAPLRYIVRAVQVADNAPAVHVSRNSSRREEVSMRRLARE
jgi:sortase A